METTTIAKNTASENYPETKSFTDEMLAWVRGKGKIIIIIHDNPDPDSLAAAMALRHLFVMKLNSDPVIAFSGMIGRSENIAMAKELEIPLIPLSVVTLDEFKVVCMLDTQPGTGNNSLPQDTRVDLIIDHHPIREDSKTCRWVDIRPEYGVTATILYEYLIAQDIYISTKMATSLFYAIKSETQDLGREANQPDRDAYLRLFPLTNKNLLYEITHPKLPMEHFLTIHNALEHASIYHNVLVVNLSTIIIPEVVSEIADFLIRLEGIETVLSMGHYNDKVILSIRTTNHQINAGEIIKVLVAGRGTAGGHGLTAGGKLDNVSFSHATMQEIEIFLTKKLLAELSLEYSTPQRLIKPQT